MYELHNIALTPEQSVEPGLCPSDAWIPALAIQGGTLFDVARHNHIAVPGSWAWQTGAVKTNNIDIGTGIVPVSFTIILRLKPNATTNNHRLWSAGYTKAELLFYSNRFNLYGGGYDIYPAAAAAAAGVWYTVTCVVQQGVKAELYVNGLLVGNDTSISTTTLTALYISGRGGTDRADMDFSHFYYYDRILSAAQIRRISDDIWLPFRRKTDIPMFVPSGAGTAFTRTIDETVGVTDAAARAGVIIRILSETVGATDAEAKAQNKVIADPLGLSETVSHVYGAIRTAADTLGLADDLSRVWGKVTTLSETIGLTDDLTRLAVLARVLSETVGITDLASIFSAETITITDTMGITDDVSRLIAYLRAPTDDIGMLDSMLRVTAALCVISDTAGLTDNVKTKLGDVVAAAFAFMILRQTR